MDEEKKEITMDNSDDNKQLMSEKSKAVSGGKNVVDDVDEDPLQNSGSAAAAAAGSVSGDAPAACSSALGVSGPGSSSGSEGPIKITMRTSTNVKPGIPPGTMGTGSSDNEINPVTGFKKPVLMFGPRPGLRKTDKKVQDVLAGKADEEKKQVAKKTKSKDSIKETGSLPGDKTNANKKESDEAVSSKEDEQTKEPKQAMSGLSPAEQLKQNSISLPYKEPIWAGLCEEGAYKFEVLKNGRIIDEIDLTVKTFFVFGRLPSCDVTLEHPSLSRYHAVMQYCAKENSLHKIGWYLYDLDSTHGTWINKNKVKPREYFRVRVGHVLKFGGSSRLFILQGPPDDQEEEAALSIKEMKEQREKQKMATQVLRQAELEERERKETILTQDTSCSWGIDMEEAEEVNAENPFAQEVPVNEDLYLEDPKKALRGYFEREGFDMPQYEFLEVGFGKQHCKVELPVDSPTGEPIFAESVVSGKKKEAVVQCALEACRILDRMGELRKANHESHKKKAKNWADDDYYDSDEDTFLDRTGTIEKKRVERMKKAGKHESTVQTYDTLVEKLSSVQEEMMSLENQLEKARKDAMQHESDEVDDLDAYMSSIKSGAMDKSTRMKLKALLFELKQEEQKLKKLVNVAKPAALPQFSKSTEGNKSSSTPQKSLPMFGKMKRPSGTGPRKIGVIGPPKPSEVASPEAKSVVEEDEDSDDDTDKAADVEARIPKKDISPISQPMDVSSSKDKSITEKLKEKKPAIKPSHAMKRTLLPGLQKNIEKKKLKPASDYDESDPDYAVWMPPKDQSGDGKTSLNEKYGY